jgi:serine/threonine-protein kinase
MLLVAAGILVLIGAIFIGRELFGGGNTGSEIPVPNLVGETLADAQKQGVNGGFTVEESGQDYCEQDKGKICSQTPDSGTIERDGTITVVISKGPELITVPDVKGLTLEAATQELEDKGFEVESKEVVSERTVGTVTDQSPNAGVDKPKGTTITLSIAKESPKVTVPDVINKPLAEAQAQLTPLGLEVDTQETERDDVAPGTVVQQTPVGNTQVKPGSTVTLTVAKASATFPMPDVTNQKLKDVKKALQDAGLTIASIAGPGDDNAIVIASTPLAGTPVKPGDSVALFTTADGGGGGDGSIFGGPTGAVRSDT